MKKQIFTMALALIGSAAMAQTPFIVWEENLGGTNQDVATYTAITSDGGYIVTGYTNSDNVDVIGHKSGFDAWVVKLNSAGSVEWKKIFGGDNDDKAYSIIQDTGGKYIFAGTTNSTNGDISSNNGAFDMWVVKLDTDGSILFSKTLGGSDDEAAYDIAQSSDGGYVLAGESKTDMLAGNINKGGFDAYIAKITNSGTTSFQKLYGGSADESMKSVGITATGVIFAAGETLSNDYDVSGNKGGADYWVLRLKSNGSLVWAKTYGGTSNDNAHSLAITGNAVVIVGETESNNGNVGMNYGGDDFWALKIRANGAITYSKVYGGETSDIARTVVRTSDGGVIIAGESESDSDHVSNNYGADDFWVIKLNTNGIKQFEKNYGGADTDIAYGIAQSADGNYIVVGASQSDNVDVSDNNGNDDFWVVRFDNPLARFAATEEIRATTVSVFPNPIVNAAIIESAELIQSVTIISMSGSTMEEKMVNSTQSTIDMQSFASGLYLIKVVFENNSVEVIQVVKN